MSLSLHGGFQDVIRGFLWISMRSNLKRNEAGGQRQTTRGDLLGSNLQTLWNISHLTVETYLRTN